MTGRKDCLTSASSTKAGLKTLVRGPVPSQREAPLSPKMETR
jgi:hypothetical protein